MGPVYIQSFVRSEEALISKGTEMQLSSLGKTF